MGESKREIYGIVLEATGLESGSRFLVTTPEAELYQRLVPCCHHRWSKNISTPSIGCLALAGSITPRAPSFCVSVVTHPPLSQNLGAEILKCYPKRSSSHLKHEWKSYPNNWFTRV